MSAKDAGTPGLTVADRDIEQYERGRRDGTAWARDYATPEELHDFLAAFQPAEGAAAGAGHSLRVFLTGTGQASLVRAPRQDIPFWRGFAAGAEEVMDDACPPQIS
jgi:hypothetical protein